MASTRGVRWELGTANVAGVYFRVANGFWDPHTANSEKIFVVGIKMPGELCVSANITRIKKKRNLTIIGCEGKIRVG